MLDIDTHRDHLKIFRNIYWDTDCVMCFKHTGRSFLYNCCHVLDIRTNKTRCWIICLNNRRYFHAFGVATSIRQCTTPTLYGVYKINLFLVNQFLTLRERYKKKLIAIQCIVKFSLHFFFSWKHKQKENINIIKQNKRRGLTPEQGYCFHFLI